MATCMRMGITTTTKIDLPVGAGLPAINRVAQIYRGQARSLSAYSKCRLKRHTP